MITRIFKLAAGYVDVGSRISSDLSRVEKGVESDSSKLASSSVPSLQIPVNSCAWGVFLFAMALMYGSYGVLVHSCELNGTLPYSTAAVALLIEFSKLSITLILQFTVTLRVHREKASCSLSSVLSTCGRVGAQMVRFRTSVPFLVPAILYTINNNLAQFLQLEMDPATYQVLSNLKIVTTTVLYRAIIRKPISTTHYCALGILTVASMLNTVGGLTFNNVVPPLLTNSSQPQLSKPTEALHIHITLLGVVMLLVYTIVSGLSGVCSEYILKRNAQLSLHLQNAYLYAYGVLLNIIVFFAQTHESGSDGRLVLLGASLLRGFSATTWVLIVTQSCVGLMMSAVMKFSSNITRLFVIGCAMMCSTVLSVVFFALQLNVCFCLSFVLAIVALCLYQTEGRCG